MVIFRCDRLLLGSSIPHSAVYDQQIRWYARIGFDYFLPSRKAVNRELSSLHKSQNLMMFAGKKSAIGNSTFDSCTLFTDGPRVRDLVQLNWVYRCWTNTLTGSLGRYTQFAWASLSLNRNWQKFVSRTFPVASHGRRRAVYVGQKNGQAGHGRTNHGIVFECSGTTFPMESMSVSASFHSKITSRCEGNHEWSMRRHSSTWYRHSFAPSTTLTDPTILCTMCPLY